MANSKEAIPSGCQFLIGGLAGITATTFVHPMELLKNRMQLSSVGTAMNTRKSTFHVCCSVVRNEGLLALYNGLSAAWLRQATYSTMRLGIYNSLTSSYTTNYGTPPPFICKIGIGSLAGAIGAIVGNPSELVLVRMTADGKLPPAERRNYSNAFTALADITKEEGILKLWCGVVPTMIRAVIVNSVQLGFYSQSKELLGKTIFIEDGIGLHICSSMVSGFFTAVASMPADIVKTRLQNMKVIKGKPEFSGAADVLKKLIVAEGFFSLWKGFTPYLARIGPSTILTLVFVEQYTHAYRKYCM